MKIKDIGGEFALIDRLRQKVPAGHPDLLVGIGDDAAVIGLTDGGEALILVTTDMLVEGRHFNRRWSTAREIGLKAVACNVSDIAAMGGNPTFMFVSMALPADTDLDWVDDLVQGIGEACTSYGATIAGGDTTAGAQVVINITLLGRVSPDHLRLRAHAQPGDLLCVTGSLGASAAALAMFEAGLEPPTYLKTKHLTPGCRLDVAPAIAEHARAMIDISDGLAAEVNHICDQSGTGAVIEADAIPIHAQTAAAAIRTGGDALTFALAGGEDFELLFSIPPEGRYKLEQAGLPCTVIGRIIPDDKARILVTPDGEQRSLAGGHDHFA